MADPIRPPSTSPALAQSLIKQLRETPSLNETDFAYMYQNAIEDKGYADQVKALFAPSNNNVSEGERQAFYKFVNGQVHAGLTSRVDTNLATVGGVNVSPEDVMLVGGGMLAAAKGTSTAIRLAKGAAQGAAPIVKYETAKYGLHTLGLPMPLATIAATVISGINRRGTAEVPAATTSMEETINQAVAKGQLRRAPGWTPEQGPLTRPPKPTIAAPEPPVSPQPGPARPPIQVEPPAATTPTPPATPIAQGVAMKQGVDAFSAVKVMPQPGEVSWVTHWIQRGQTPAEAVQKAMTLRAEAPVITKSLPPSDWFDEWLATHDPSELPDLVRKSQGRAMTGTIKEQLEATLKAAKK